MRTIHTPTEAAKAAKVAEHAKLVTELTELIPTMHPQHKAYAEDVLREVNTWTPQELAPLLPRLRSLDRHAKEWATLTPEQRTKRGDDAYYAMYRMRRD